MYRLLRPLLFLLDAERAHHVITALFRLLMRIPVVGAWIARRNRVRDPRLAQRVWGLAFESPVGLAAGFDKNARLYRAMAGLGFGLVEVGTVTARPQPGNPRPRLFRLPADRALLNRFGFNNDGAQAVAERLAAGRSPVPLGVNLGRSKVVSNEEAVADYLESLEAVWSHADWITVNVSSPNTPELRALQAREHLAPLLRALRERLAALAVAAGRRGPPPLLVKIAPDLDADSAALDDLCATLREERIDGVICGNTTLARAPLLTPAVEVEGFGAGGLSGPPLHARMCRLVRWLRERLGPEVPIVASGGIEDAETAWQAIEAGASLIQLYTGLIYKGPGLVREIHRGLCARLEARGLSSLAEAVGRGAAPYGEVRAG
jgi:dihydroorotate dehydrogenase